MLQKKTYLCAKIIIICNILCYSVICFCL